MKKFWNISLAILLSSCLLTGAVGCGKSDDSSSSSSATDSTAEDSQPVTESNPDDMSYTLTYDSSAVPDDLANAIAMYFYAVETQNYDLYAEQLNPLYQTSMEAFLQEQYGYGLETSLEQYHQTLAEYAQGDDSSSDSSEDSVAASGDFTITGLELAQAEEVLADSYDSGTDFVSEYMDAYTEVFGEEFTTQLQTDATAIYDIAVTMTGTDGEGNDITILDNLEMLVVETDGTFGILG